MKKLRSNGLVFVVVFVCLPFFFQCLVNLQQVRCDTYTKMKLE